MHEGLWQGFEARRFVGILFVALPELQFLEEGPSCRGAVLGLVSARVLIVGGDHAGSYALRISASHRSTLSKFNALISWATVRFCQVASTCWRCSDVKVER